MPRLRRADEPTPAPELLAALRAAFHAHPHFFGLATRSDPAPSQLLQVEWRDALSGERGFLGRTDLAGAAALLSEIKTLRTKEKVWKELNAASSASKTATCR